MDQRASLVVLKSAFARLTRSYSVPRHDLFDSLVHGEIVIVLAQLQDQTATLMRTMVREQDVSEQSTKRSIGISLMLGGVISPLHIFRPNRPRNDERCNNLLHACMLSHSNS